MARTYSTKPTDLGANRTGTLTAPARRAEMAENTDAVVAQPLDAMGLGLARAELSSDAPPVGTMPIPGTVRGAAKTVVEALKGEKLSVFLDKLGERLAFERTGVRLYEAVLAKLPGAEVSEGDLSAVELRRFREEELQHFLLVQEAIERLGGDPTAVTPCADVAAVQSQGLVQVVTDPRTTLTQCLDALLTIELVDGDGWKHLIAMCEAIGQEELARRFTQALAEEDVHLSSVRRWIAQRLGLALGAKLPAPEFGVPPQTT